MTERGHRILTVAVALNFAAFIAIDIILGGDALGGRLENGRYFLNNHGIPTEVSHATFVYSACHAYSALLGLLLLAYVGIYRRRRAIRS